MPKQMIEIQFQFQNVAENFKKAGETAGEEFHDAMEKETDRRAQEGGGAMFKMITAWKAALMSFDWGHPITSLQRSASALFSELQQRLGVVGKAVVGLLGAAMLMFRSLLDPQRQMVQLFSQLRVNVEGVGDSMEQKMLVALRDISDVAATTGKSMSDIASTYATLGQMRVPVSDLKELTELTTIGASALGANVDQMAELVGALRVMGRVGVEGIESVVQTFSDVQDAVGLTQNEMSGLINTTTELSRYLGVFGAAPEDIEEMASATAKLTGIFGELGLGAERAGQIMTRLFDPSRLQENVFLISQMGMSMQEYMNMLQGGQVDQVKLTEGLIDAAGQIEEMRQAGVNAFALQQRAQMMGFANVSEALRLAQEGDERLADMNAEMERLNREREQFGGRTLAEAAAEGMSDLSGVVERLRNRFQAAFARTLIPLVSKMTEWVGKLEQRFLENEDEIMNFLTQMVDAVGEFLVSLDFNKIGNFFRSLWNGAKAVVSTLEKLLPIAKALLVSFVAFKAASFILPLFGGLKNILGGLLPGLKATSTAASSAGSAMSNMGGALKAGLGSFLKMGGVALIIMSIAGAMFILAQALKTMNDVEWESLAKGALVLGALVGTVMILGNQKATSLAAAATLVALSASMYVMAQAMMVFNNVEWGSLAKAAVALIGFTAAMIGLGAIFMSPVGALILAGLAALALMSGVIIIFAMAIRSLGEALESLSPDAISGLAEIASPELAKNLGIVGSAINELLKPIRLVQLLKSRSLMEVGVAIKQLALGLFVLSETPDFIEIAENLEIVAQSISEVLKGNLKGNVEEVGSGFELLTEGIENLTQLETGQLGSLGDDMLSMLAGLQGFLQAMREGATRDFLGMGKNLEELGKGFKDLSLGLFVLGETGDKLQWFLDNSDKLSESVSELLDALGEGGRRDLMESGEAFKSFADGLKEFGAIREEDLSLEWMMNNSQQIGTAVKTVVEAMGSYMTGLTDVGEGFKQVALGIFVLGEAGDKAGWFLDDHQELTAGITGIMNAISNVNRRDVEAGSEAFKIFSEALSGMSNLSDVSASFRPAANGIAMLASGLERFSNFGGRRGAANDFIEFIRGLNEAGPIQVNMQTPEGAEVDVTGRMTDLEGAGSVEVDMKIAYEQQTTRVVEALERIENSLVGEEGMLTTIMTTMSGWTRTGLKTRPV